MKAVPVRGRSDDTSSPAQFTQFGTFELSTSTSTHGQESFSDDFLAYFVRHHCTRRNADDSAVSLDEFPRTGIAGAVPEFPFSRGRGLKITRRRTNFFSQSQFSGWGKLCRTKPATEYQFRRNNLPWPVPREDLHFLSVSGQRAPNASLPLAVGAPFPAVRAPLGCDVPGPGVT